MSVAKFTSSYITFVYFSGFELLKYNKLNKNNHLFHIRFISDCADGLRPRPENSLILCTVHAFQNRKRFYGVSMFAVQQLYMGRQ